MLKLDSLINTETKRYRCQTSKLLLRRDANMAHKK